MQLTGKISQKLKLKFDFIIVFECDDEEATQFCFGVGNRI